MRKQPGNWAVVSIAVLFVAGCGGSDSVEVYPVKGTVKYNGQPMKGGGSIAFIPAPGTKGKAPGGMINEDGTYTLTTYEEGDGSMVGEFRVLVTQETAKEPPVSEDGGAAPEAVVSVPAADQIPSIYSDPKGSDLKAKVEAKDNVIDFDLKPQ